ncbi:MAG: PLD nuclease N-terminal domain-containing protein [Bacteroidota bacterium]
MTRLRSLPFLALGLLAVVLVGCGGDNAFSVATGVGGLCSLLHLVAIVWAFVQIANSTADAGSKILWALAVFFFPVVGLVLWYFFGPRS